MKLEYHEIKQAFSFLFCNTFYRMRINHGGKYIAMPKQLLDRANIIIRLKQMTGKAVAKGMCSSSLTDSCFPDCFFNCFLHMCLMKMVVASILLCVLEKG